MRLNEKILGGLVLLVSFSVSADEWDGSEPIICAATETVVCDEGKKCVQGPPSLVNLPLFFKIDITEEVVRTTKESGEERASAINTAVQDSDFLVLQGIEAGVSWGMTVGLTDGKMTLSASTSEVGYLVFGRCTLL